MAHHVKMCSSALPYQIINTMYLHWSAEGRISTSCPVMYMWVMHVPGGSLVCAGKQRETTSLNPEYLLIAICQVSSSMQESVGIWFTKAGIVRHFSVNAAPDEHTLTLASRGQSRIFSPPLVSSLGRCINLGPQTQRHTVLFFFLRD